MRGRTALAVVLASAGWMWVQDGGAWANPVDAFGFGARAASMGGAQTAAARDGGASYYNPALLATFDDIRVDLGYQVAAPVLLLNGQDVGADASRGSTASLVVPGRVSGVRVALGGAMFLPDQHLTRTRTLPSAKPRFVVYDNRPQRLFLAANLSVQLGERWFVGAGLAYMSSTRGTVVLDGRLGFPNADNSDLNLGIDVDLKTIRYPHLGIWARLAPWLDAGLSYRGGFKLVLDQTFIVQGDVGPEGGAPLVEDGYFRLHTVSQDLFQPSQITAGLSARITPAWMLAFDVAWQRWSAFENPAAHIDIELDVGQFNDLVDIPEAPPLPAARFHDIVVPRLGLEWTGARTRRRTVHVRGGYVYEPSPVPGQYGESNFIDNDKHTVSLGAGVTLQGVTQVLLRPFSIDGFVAVTVLAPRVHLKLSPADPVGDYRSSGHLWQAGISSRWRF